MLEKAENRSLEFWANETPNRPAIICDGKVLTYFEWNRLANRVADSLLKHGLKPGDRLGMRFHLGPEWFVLQRALQKIGVVQVAVNWKLTPSEARYILEDSEAIGLACDDPDVQPWADGHLQTLVTHGQSSDAPGIRLEDLIRDGDEVDRFGSLANEMILYTSGTTGAPKGVAPGVRDGISIERLDSYRNALNAVPPRKDGLVELLALPVHHGAGPAAATAVCRCGGTVILLEKFDPEKALRLISEHRVQVWVSVPTMLTRIKELPQDIRAKYDLSSLSAIVTGAAPVPYSLKIWVNENIGSDLLWEVYGCSEGGMISYTSPDHQLKKPGTSGLPYDGVDIAIIDEDWNTLSSGETGEIAVNTPAVFRHYLGQELESEALIRDGYYRTGDVGRLDEDGFLYITDRIKDMIVAGGVNIYPAEIEATIVEHPQVESCAVIGVPEGDFGEKPFAFVVASSSATDLNEQSILNFLDGRLAKYKWPRDVKFVSELPMNTMGKVTKQVLRAPFWHGRSRNV